MLLRLHHLFCGLYFLFGVLVGYHLISPLNAGSGGIDPDEFQRAGRTYFDTTPPELDDDDYKTSRSALSKINSAYLKSNFECSAVREKIVSKAFPRYIKFLEPLEALFIGNDLRMYYFLMLVLYKETARYKRGLQTLEKLYESSPMSYLYYLYLKGPLLYHAYMQGQCGSDDSRETRLRNLLDELEKDKQLTNRLQKSSQRRAQIRASSALPDSNNLTLQKGRATYLRERFRQLEAFDHVSQQDQMLMTIVGQGVHLAEEAWSASPLPLKVYEEKFYLLSEGVSYLMAKARKEREISYPYVRKKINRSREIRKSLSRRVKNQAQPPAGLMIEQAERLANSFNVHIKFAPSRGGEFAAKIFYASFFGKLSNPLQMRATEILNVLTYSLGMEELFDHLHAASLISQNVPPRFVSPCELWKLSINESFGLYFTWKNGKWNSVSFGNFH